MPIEEDICVKVSSGQELITFNLKHETTSNSPVEILYKGQQSNGECERYTLTITTLVLHWVQSLEASQSWREYQHSQKLNSDAYLMYSANAFLHSAMISV